MQHIHFIRIGAITAAILAIPLVAMQFTQEVNWTLSDFLFAGILLFGIGTAYEWVSRRGGTLAYRLATAIACGATLLLVWVNAAVGIIGDGPVNTWYVAVPLILIVGSIAVRLRPQGMMYVLFAAAASMMLIPTLAFFMMHPSFDPGVAQVFLINAVFASLFCASALFFKQAADEGMAAV